MDTDRQTDAEPTPDGYADAARDLEAQVRTLTCQLSYGQLDTVLDTLRFAAEEAQEAADEGLAEDTDAKREEAADLRLVASCLGLAWQEGVPVLAETLRSTPTPESGSTPGPWVASNPGDLVESRAGAEQPVVTGTLLVVHHDDGIGIVQTSGSGSRRRSVGNLRRVEGS